MQLSDRKIAVCALARDCVTALQKNIPKIEKLCSYFGDYIIVVVENDSIDGTKEILFNWKKLNSNVSILSEDRGERTIPLGDKTQAMRSMYRIDRMAKYRNLYLEFLRNNCPLDIDYVVMMDIDIDSFDINGVVDSIINAPIGWNALFANGTQRLCLFGYAIYKKQYDMFAYLHFKDDLTDLEYRRKQKRVIDKRIKKEVFSPCASAFGGLAVYSWKAVSHLCYSSLYNENEQVAFCEHISFNKEIKGGKFICYHMDVSYGKFSLGGIMRLILPNFLFERIYKLYLKY